MEARGKYFWVFLFVCLLLVLKRGKKAVYVSESIMAKVAKGKEKSHYPSLFREIREMFNKEKYESYYILMYSCKTFYRNELTS